VGIRAPREPPFSEQRSASVNYVYQPKS
jgi:mannose-6-phosphate isomerase-like protein (cupin superfamily)